MRISSRNNFLFALIAVVLLLGVWKIVSLFVKAEIILPPPETVLKETLLLIVSPDFWPALGSTVVRGLLGFLLSCAAALVIGIAAGLSRPFHIFIKPVLAVVRSTPVMSVILLALIWFTSDSVPVFVSFLMAFPIVCGNIIQGIVEVDTGMVQMARMYRVSPKNILLHVYLPSILPYFIAGVNTAIGITWKVVIAAEVLAQPVRAVGTGLQEARMNLETPVVLAWTVFAILLSVASEKLLSLFFRRIPWRNR